MNIISHLMSVRFEVARQLGLPGLIGSILIVLSALLLLLTPRVERETQTMQQRAAIQEQTLKADRRTKQNVPQSSEQLARFDAWLPALRENANDLQNVLAEANKAKLEINNAEYHISSQAGQQFIKYEMIFPVKANYITIRSFVAGVLNAEPHAALAELQMGRQAANSDMLDARIHFTFFYRGA